MSGRQALAQASRRRARTIASQARWTAAPKWQASFRLHCKSQAIAEKYSAYRYGIASGVFQTAETVLICALSGLLEGLGTKIRECSMIKKSTFAAALLAATVLSGVASAKTFVYCSEASPEGFDPGLYTAGTTFDASRAPGLQPPARVQARHDRDRARPRRELGDFRRRPAIHVQAAPGREVPDHRILHPDPRPQRRRRDLLLRAPVEDGQSLEQVCRPAPPGNISPAWACPT